MAITTGNYCGCGCPLCWEGNHCYVCSPRHEWERLYRDNKRLEQENFWLRRQSNHYSSLELSGFSGGLCLSEPKKNMKYKLSVLAKKVLDKDLRSLVRAGILDDSLEVTDKGVNFLLSDYLAKNKSRLATEVRKNKKK